MNDVSTQKCESELSTEEIKELHEIPDQDDRYPGSFFRIPGIAIPGKTTWSLK